MHEQERAEQHADADAGKQIDENGEQEGGEQHDRVGARGTQQSPNSALSAIAQATTTSTPASAASGI